MEKKLEKEFWKLMKMAKNLSDDQISYVMNEAKKKFGLSDESADTLGVILLTSRMLEVEEDE